MTSSENLPTIDSWLNRTTPFTDTWLSESFARDTETLTRALQQSISSDTFPLSPLPTPAPVTAAISSSGSGPEPAAPQRRIPVAAKITKRKSRASKRATTTFITADPANFRQMVQQVTGVRFSSVGGYTAELLKPEPQRAMGRLQACLPTLDTSAFLLESAYPNSYPNSVPASMEAPLPSLVADSGAGVGFDFESFSCFPTLESGKVMY